MLRYAVINTSKGVISRDNAHKIQEIFIHIEIGCNMQFVLPRTQQIDVKSPPSTNLKSAVERKDRQRQKIVGSMIKYNTSEADKNMCPCFQNIIGTF